VPALVGETQFAEGGVMPASSVVGWRLADNQVTTECEKPCGALGGNRRSAEAPSNDHVERSSPQAIVGGLFGTAFEHGYPFTQVQDSNCLLEEGRPPPVAVEQYPSRIRPALCEDQPGHTTTTAEVKSLRWVGDRARKGGRMREMSVDRARAEKPQSLGAEQNPPQLAQVASVAAATG
jgi:hypothetical protein